MKSFDNSYIICSCGTPEHLVILTYDKIEKDIYIQTQLHQYRSFFKRIVTAFKYIFNYTSKYGHWDCTLIDKEQANKIYHFFNRYKDRI